MPEPLEITMVRKITKLEETLRRIQTYTHGGTIGEVLGAYLFLPALRAFWPFSAQAYNAGGISYLTDMSGNSRHLASINAPTYGILDDILPYGAFTAASSMQFIRPNEPELHPDSTHGITVGCWVENTTPPGALASMGLVTKWKAGAGNYGFALEMYNDGVGTYAQFKMSTDGTGIKTVTHTTALSTGWHLLIGRFAPGSTLSVLDNGVKVDNSTAIPASVYRPAVDFSLGGIDGGDYLDGYMSLAFLCADALDDAILARLLKASRIFFGV